MKRAATLLTISAATIAGIWSGTGPVAAAPLPVRWDSLTALGPGLFPENPPAGANVPCKPSAAHPNPVVLVNPTGTNQALAYSSAAPFLKNAGYCVFTFNHGNPAYLPEVPVQGVGDIRRSAETLQAAVRDVLRRTGAKKVDLVGHSQGGGILPAYYLNVMDGAKYVDKLIGVSPSHHGTSLSTVGLLQPIFGPIGPAVMKVLEVLAPALSQQAISSDLASLVYRDGDTRPGVTYTTIVSTFDQVVTPYTRQYLKGEKVTNITLQESCKQDWSEHVSTLYNRRAWNHVLNALAGAPGKPVACEPVAPYFGSEPQPWAFDMAALQRLAAK